MLWLQIRSYVIPRRVFREFMQWARRQDWYGRWMPEGARISEAYLGEWPWQPSIRAYADERCEIGDWAETGEAPTDVLPTWVDYQGGNRDASIPEGASTVLPAQWLVTRQNLRWDHGSFAFHLPDQQVVALDPACQDRGPSALLFSEDLMRQLLDEEDSSLVWTVLGEKEHLRQLPRRGRGKSWQFLESVHSNLAQSVSK